MNIRKLPCIKLLNFKNETGNILPIIKMKKQSDVKEPWSLGDFTSSLGPTLISRPTWTAV
jgi:hypothetical protein